MAPRPQPASDALDQAAVTGYVMQGKAADHQVQAPRRQGKNLGAGTAIPHLRLGAACGQREHPRSWGDTENTAGAPADQPPPQRATAPAPLQDAGPPPAAEQAGDCRPPPRPLSTRPPQRP